MTTTESYTAAASQTREATEKSAELWKQSAQSFADRAGRLAELPTVDVTQPVELYFNYVQKAVDLNREAAIRWAEVFSALSASVRNQAKSFGDTVKQQIDAVAESAVEQAESAEQVANEQADKVEEAEKEQARLARQAERAAAKQAHEQAREPYQGLTKAELSDRLAERELPKTGTVEELIERLVEADSK